MKKRLRKKRHLKEFAVRGVSLKSTFTSDITEEAFSAFIDDFISEGIEKLHLQFGGGGARDEGWNGVLEPEPPQRAIPAEKLEAIRQWLASRKELASYELSDPWDIWYGRDPYAV